MLACNMSSCAMCMCACIINSPFNYVTYVDENPQMADSVKYMSMSMSTLVPTNIEGVVGAKSKIINYSTRIKPFFLVTSKWLLTSQGQRSKINIYCFRLQLES